MHLHRKKQPFVDFFHSPDTMLRKKAFFEVKGGNMGQAALTTEHIETLDFGFGTFRFYRRLVIGEIREGIVINADHALELMSYGFEYYKEAPSIVYISDRKHSYSIDPTMHLETGRIFPKLAGYGIVCYNDLNVRVARLEQRFLPYPSRIFRSLDKAIHWAGECIHPTGVQA